MFIQNSTNWLAQDFNTKKISAISGIKTKQIGKTLKKPCLVINLKYFNWYAQIHVIVKQICRNLSQ